MQRYHPPVATVGLIVNCQGHRPIVPFGGSYGVPDQLGGSYGVPDQLHVLESIQLAQYLIVCDQYFVVVSLQF